ncbi:MAG: ActS/PrrB/RegB family redox-sensitive histidine kinase [Paracoccaceae bacterium]
MATAAPVLINEQPRRNWVRLRTFILLRWIAIVGQLSAIVLSFFLFDLQLDLGLCFMAIGASIVANLIATFAYPVNRRLSEREVSFMLIFDLIQLAVLLYLTGGLHNPFALLILAPVTISATALRTGPAVVVGATAIALATFVLWFHIPLQTSRGVVLRMPQILVFGFWAAIVIGVTFLGVYARRVTSEINSMSEALLAAQMALVREQKITDLAGVVAATAHELGTPLATIKLASGELIQDLIKNPVLQEDAQLIHDQADRCRDILQSMGQAGKDDLHLRQTPLTALLVEAAEPHNDRGKTIVFSPGPDIASAGPVPIVWRRPEIIHGLRNLIQNAVDFAESTVWIDAIWANGQVSIRIIDDGRGFSQQIIGRLGDPYLRNRPEGTDQEKRPGYQGMGLGLFIAKTLLERSGAELSFANARDHYPTSLKPGQRSGAIVEVIWQTEDLCPDPNTTGTGLGDNQLISTEFHS